MDAPASINRFIEEPHGELLNICLHNKALEALQLFKEQLSSIFINIAKKF